MDSETKSDLNIISKETVDVSLDDLLDSSENNDTSKDSSSETENAGTVENVLLDEEEKIEGMEVKDVVVDQDEPVENPALIEDTSVEKDSIIEETIIPESDNVELELQEIEIADPIFDLSKTESEDAIKIKNPNDVYQELYRKAKHKARKAKEEALHAIMEANSIRNTYMLDDLDESDLSDFEDEDEDEDEDQYDKRTTEQIMTG